MPLSRNIAESCFCTFLAYFLPADEVYNTSVPFAEGLAAFKCSSITKSKLPELIWFNLYGFSCLEEVNFFSGQIIFLTLVADLFTNFRCAVYDFHFHSFKSAMKDNF